MTMQGSAIKPTVSHFEFDPAFTIPELFLAQVRSHPSKIAVIEDDWKLTYSDLARLVLGLADRLSGAGVTRGDRVGLFAGRGVETVAAQLAVLLLGAAFVPLDPAMPRQHHAEVLAQALIGTVVAHPSNFPAARAIAGHSPSVRIVAADAPPQKMTDAATLAALAATAARVGAEDLAYVIFTSGSTGRPKGVMVAHRGVCRLVRGQSYADLGPDQVMLNMAAVGFDASIGEIYSALLNGGTLAILPDATPSLDRIAQVIARDGVTIAYITAGLFHIIAEHRPTLLAPLRQVFPCGDVLSEAHVRRLREILPDLRMINGYGPTENTVFTCCYPIDDRWRGGPIPIGLGLEHDLLFVLDDDLRPVADGARGQLAVGGHGMALGYLGQPELTQAAFVPLRTRDFDGTVYLTGDLVRRRGDGVIWFHGRVDRQVKINGQRVELDAVEHALRACAGVRDAVAVATDRPSGGKEVVAFVKTADGDTLDMSEGGLRAALKAGLPAAAIPSRIEIRGDFPLNGSGKVDRKHLAASLSLSASPRGTGTSTGAARGLGDRIRQAWEAELGHPVTDPTRTFFECGGTSLQLVAVHARLQGTLGVRFDIARLFEAPRIADLETLIARLDGGSDAGAEVDPVAASRIAMARGRGRRRMTR